MKSLKSKLVLLLTTFLSLYSIAQENPNPPMEDSGLKQVRMYIEYFEVPTQELKSIMSLPREKNHDTEMRTTLLAKLKEGKVSMLESQSVVTRSGEFLLSESIIDFIYPKKYDLRKKPKEKNEKSSPKLDTPLEFDTRKLGSKQLVALMISDNNKSLDVTIKSNIGYYTASALFGSTPDSKVLHKMPSIYTLNIDRKFACPDNKFILIDSIVPTDDEGNEEKSKKILVFLKASIIKVAK